MGYTVSGLSAYVETRKDALVKDLVLGGVKGDTIPNLAKQLGIKTKERINYLDVTPAIQNGQGCGFSASGSTVLTNRDLETAIMKVNDSWCNDDLLGKFAEYMVRFGADANAEDGFGFEEEILRQVVGGVNEQMERLVWQGATSGNSGSDLIDGFITLAANNDSASTITASTTAATTAISVYNEIKKVIMLIPEEIIDDAVVFVAPAVYRAFVQEMVEKNYYHYESGKIENNDLIFPGTNIRVHKTIGLTGDLKHIYASTYKNMFYGCDMMNDKEEVRVWFSDDDDVYKIKLKWNAGVMTAFPDEVVLLTSTNNLA